MAEERDDVEVAWARIVADYDRKVDDAVGRWPAQEDVAEPSDAAGSSRVWTDDAPVRRLGSEPADDDRRGPGDSAPTGRLDREDEHHYVPPDPPPLGRPDLPTGLAWGGVIGGPLLLLLSTLLTWGLPQLLTAACVVGFVGGIVFLVANMDDGRGRDGWDDGAQV